MMSDEQIGMYIRALNYSWVNDGIPADAETIFALFGPRRGAERAREWSRKGQRWVSQWSLVGSCFAPGEDGRLRNPRQEKEREWATERIDNSKKANNVKSFRSVSKKAMISSEDEFESSISGGLHSVSYSDTEQNIEKREERRDLSYVDFDTFLNIFSRHRGFKKPPAPVRDKARMKWREIYITDEQLGAALDGYYESEWGKSQSYPILGFLKDPESWISGDVPKAQTFSISVPRLEGSIPQPESATATETASALPSTAQEWNRIVVSGPQVQIWRPNRWDKAEFDGIMSDPDFNRNLPGLLEKCERALQSGSKWVTFEWLLKNWGKVLNGSLGSGAAEKPKSMSGTAERAIARRKREREQAEARAKEAQAVQ